jgi:hypothetical protein
MGRPKGAETRRKEFRLEERQVAHLEALIEAAPLGKPTLVSVVRQAVQEFIDRQLLDAEVRSRVERILGRPKVVSIHTRRSGDSS